MKYLTFLILILTSLQSFSDAHDISKNIIVATITGKVIGRDSGFLKLTNSTTKKTDTIYFINSEFNYKAKFSNYDSYSIDINQDYYSYSFLFDTSSITLSINLNTHEFVVKGGFENRMYQYIKDINSPYYSTIYEINNKLSSFKKEQNLDSVIVYEIKRDSVEYARVNNQILKTKMAVKGYYQISLAYSILNSKSRKDFYQYWKSIPKNIRETTSGEKVLQVYTNLNKRDSLVNKKFITLNLFNNDSLKVSPTINILALYDFWATWCGPCIEEFPLVNKLKEKKLQVIQVSIDKSFLKWKTYINNHTIQGTQYWISQKDAQLIENYSLGLIPLKVMVLNNKVIAINPSYNTIVTYLLKYRRIIE